MENFITPVAMNVTIEQYEQDLQKPLEDLGYEWDSVFPYKDSLPKYQQLTTQYNNVVGKLGSRVTNRGEYFIDHYNPELFLALAAMQSEKMPIVGEYVIGESSFKISNTTISKVTTIGRDGVNFSVDGRSKDSVQQTSIHFCRKATVKEIEEHFKQKHNMKKEFSIEGSVPLKEAIAKEVGYPFWFEDSVNQNITLHHITKKLFIGCGSSKKEVHFVLPQDYEKALEYIKNYHEPEFKIGDLVVVLPEDEFYYNSEKGVQPLIKYDEGCYHPFILEFRDGTINSYSKVRHATPEEIEEYKNPKLPDINGYSGRYNVFSKTLVYGCAELPIEWFKEEPHNRSIVSLELNSGVKIDKEQVQKIKNYLKVNKLL